MPIIENPTAFPILAYQHGTSSSKMDVPSNLSQEIFLPYFFVGNGFICTAADYLGLGDSRRSIHPYIHADTEASAGIDLIRASKQFMDAEGFLYTDQLFITGYSQGGHAGMAMHKEIETNLSDEFTVTAASHMSGPYNLSSTIISTSLEDSIYDFPSYVVWMFVAYQSVYGTVYENLESVFRPEYIPMIEDFTNGVITRGELNVLLIDRLTEFHGASFTNRVFTEAFLTDLQENPENPVRLALQDNDLIDWVPTAPTQLLYCMADEQVPYTNATITDSIMNANGAASVTSIDINSEADHGGCVAPATENSANFFLQFLEGAVTNTTAVNQELDFSFQPNPVSTELQVTLPDALLREPMTSSLQLFSLDGSILIEQAVTSSQQVTLPMETIPNGFYFLRLQSELGFWVEKLVVEK